MENKIKAVDGFDGEICHPALDIKGDVLILGFQFNRETKHDDEPDAEGAEKKKPKLHVEKRELVLVATMDKIKPHLRTDFFVDSARKLYVRKNKGPLPDISERWSLTDVNAFIGEFHNRKGDDGVPKASDLFKEILEAIKQYVEFEKDIDYALITAWGIGTYFLPVFSAYPFIQAKAPKRSGKSQLLDLLRQLCFNAIKARPTLAALGDTVESLRGTLIIDQADSLNNQKNEDLLETLTGSYKKNGSNRRLVDIEKGRRVIEFETYCPKVFASTKELPEDLRDRCLIVPLIRSGRNFADPNEDDWLWAELRCKLYRFLIGNFWIVLDRYRDVKRVHRETNDIVGRHLELWLPFEVMMRVCGASDVDIAAGRERFLSQYKFTESELGELDIAIIDVVLAAMGTADEVVLYPKDIAGGIAASEDSFDNPIFDSNKTERQKAGLVGFALKRMNLPDEKLSRTKNGERYRFTRARVERIRNSYFAPQSPTSEPNNADITSDAGDVKLDDLSF